MNRKEALELVIANVENENLVKHLFVTEAIMCAEAECLGKVEFALTC